MEERTTEIRRGPTPPPPWYGERWWIWLVALLLIVGVIIAFFALRGDGEEERQGSGRVTVPDVVGLQERVARARLDERGFAVETERVAHAGREGTVVEQDPGAGSRLGRGARVRIVVSTGQAQTVTQTQTETETQTTETQTTSTGPETLEVPDVVGSEYPDAVEQILEAGFLPASFPVESAEERGTVVDQQPGGGTQADGASPARLDVSLGSGPREERTVPDLTGQPLDDALRACAQAGFTCRAVPAGGAGREVTGQRPVTGRAVELAQIELSTG